MASFYWDSLWYEVREQLGFVDLQDMRDWTRIESILQSGLRNFYYPPPIPHSRDRTHIWSFMRPVVSNTLQENEEYHDLPSDFASMNSDVVFTGDSPEDRIEMVTVERMRRLKIGDRSGRPQYYSLEVGENQIFRIRLWPTPSEEYDIAYRYERTPDIDLTEKAEGDGTVSEVNGDMHLTDSGAFEDVEAGDRIRLYGDAVDSGIILLLKIESKEDDDTVVLSDSDDLSADDVDYTVYDAPELPGGEAHKETILASCMAEAESRVDEMPGQHRQRFYEALARSVSRDLTASAPLYMGPEFEQRQPGAAPGYTITWNDVLLE